MASMRTWRRSPPRGAPGRFSPSKRESTLAWKRTESPSGWKPRIWKLPWITRKWSGVMLVLVTGWSQDTSPAGYAAAMWTLDVRLPLLLCGFALFCLAGHPAAFVVHFAREMVNDKTVVPICSAMGFAYVLKRTGCERHLILLLLGAVRRVQGLLVPGGIATGYLVNTTIVSQSSTAATVGPVLLPVLEAGQ